MVKQNPYTTFSHSLGRLASLPFKTHRDPKPTLYLRSPNDRRAQIGNIAFGPRGRMSCLTSPAFHRRVAESVRRSPQDGCSEESDSRLRS